MTSKVDFVATQTAAGGEVNSPTGKAAGLTRFTIIAKDGSKVDSQDVLGLTATFTGVPDGNFTGVVQLLDTDGANLGDPVSQDFVDGEPVPPAPATYLPLISLSVTVTPEPAASAAPTLPAA